MSDNMQDLENRLQNQIDKIEEAIVKTRQNEMADMGDMDGEVAMICQKIMHSGENEVQKLESKMLEMITKLDELAVELKEYQDRVRPEG